METKSEKNHRVSFSKEEKETFLSRLALLQKGRTLLQAAEDWGVPRSTLNNYIHRGSNPRTNVIKEIAKKESVSLEWLMYGVGDAPQSSQSSQSSQHGDAAIMRVVQVIQGMSEALDSKQREQLANFLIIKAAEYITLLQNDDMQKLLQLDGRKREAALRLEKMSDEEVREILDATSSVKENSTIDQTTKRAI
ncbi:bacteriophage CI repressor [Salmonella enterica subsp. enterica]|nr:hypothetical protein [Salmonella enterica subsp. enterica serovar Mikawasima]EBR0171299.1 hypothetical protein [Salmonella enterica subsp. enterica serovar Mikawasima]EDW0320711.1 bacteriophage CI repressor [Salmonella enterica subsp. enterica serovar Mikawasima]HCP9899017.1 helix-turn-helix domain-containing protein [Salmonella enterica]